MERKSQGKNCAMRHYVDGYNLLFALFEELDDELLQNQREELIDMLNHLASHLHGEITLVFDARVAPTSTRGQIGKIEVAYTDYATDADDWIVEHVAIAKEPCTVVTNDRKLQGRCRAARAKTENVHSWITKLQKKAAKNQKEQILFSASSCSTKKIKVEPCPPTHNIDPEDPQFLERLPGESELDRWHRIFSSRKNRK